jgi:predicted transport protein
MINQKTLDKAIFKKMEASSWDKMRPIFNKFHNNILSLNKNIIGELYTIYILYTFNEKVLAIVFFKKECLTVGLALPNYVKDKKLNSKGTINYPGISKTYLITKIGDVNKKLISWLKTIIKSHLFEESL